MTGWAVVHPQVQQRLLAAQAAGSSPRETLAAVLQCWEHLSPGATAGTAADTPAAALGRLLAACPVPAAALAALAGCSGHPAAFGMALAELLARGVVPAGELLAAVPAEALAVAVTDLHAAATAATLPTPASTAAACAFESLVKLLVTSGSGGAVAQQAQQAQQAQGQEQQRAAGAALLALRRAWTASAQHPSGNSGGSGDSAGSNATSLLVAVVDVVDREVFPRQRATSWLTAELAHCLRMGTAGSGSGAAAVAQHPLMEAADSGAAAWAAAMSSFAASLPSETLLEQVQDAVWEGSLAAPCAAALLAAAATLRPKEAASRRTAVERWVCQQAVAALAQHAVPPLRSLLLLQRGLLTLLAVPPDNAAVPGASAGRQQAAAHQQQRGPPPSQQAQQAPAAASTPEQRYSAWVSDALLSGDSLQQLHFLVHQLLIPMCPEDPPRWLTAQREALLPLAERSRGAPVLPASGEAAAREYVELARTRLRAEEQQAGRQAGAAAGAGQDAALLYLVKGRQAAAGLIQEWEEGRGFLNVGTLKDVGEKAGGVFTRMQMVQGLAPALLEPCSQEEVVAQRAAFMEYLYHAVPGTSNEVMQFKRLFSPDAVARYRRLCLQCQLEGASLSELASRAPQLLLAVPPADPAGSGGGSGDKSCSSGSGGIGGHKVLDRLGRLVGEHLALWQQRQGQQQGQLGFGLPQQTGMQAPHGGDREAVSGPEELSEVLINMWTASFAALAEAGSGGSPGGSAGIPFGSSAEPSVVALAAHVLSIAHGQPLLHGPLLSRLRGQLVGEHVSLTAGDGVQQQQQQQEQQPQLISSRQRLEAAVLLATVAGALVQPLHGVQQQEQQHDGSHVRGAHLSPAGSLAALQPLFLWRQGSSGSNGEPAEISGPLWLERVLRGLSLGSVHSMARSADVAAAHISCLPLFSSYALLPRGAESESSTCPGMLPPQLQLLRWRQPAAASAAAGGYGGEFVSRLVFPACTAALRLHQWLLLRLSVARQLPGQVRRAVGISSGRAAKRQRWGGWGTGASVGAEGSEGEEEAALAEDVLQVCHTTLESDCGAPLAAAAGKLPLPAFLSLEATASGDGGSGALLPPGAAEAAFRLCCTLFLQPAVAAAVGSTGGGELAGGAELAGLVEPLVPAALPAELADGKGAELAPARMHNQCADVDVEFVPDSEDEEEREAAAAAMYARAATPAAAHQQAAGPAAAVQALAAAAAAVVIMWSEGGGSREQATGAASVGAVVTCQRACAHMLRLLGCVPGGPPLPSLLASFLCSLVEQCRQRLPAEVPPGPHGITWAQQQHQHQHTAHSTGPAWGQQQQQAVPTVACADARRAAAVQQCVVGLASGLVLELLPLPLCLGGGGGALLRERAQLAAVAEAVQSGMTGSPFLLGQPGTGQAAVRQRLEAALGGSD